MSTHPDQSLKRLVSSSGIYFLGGIAQQSIGFLLLPLYTSLLETSDYGVLELLNTFALISLMLLSLGMSSAMLKCYHRDCSNESEKRAILPLAVVLMLPGLLLGCGLIFLKSEWLAAILLGSSERAALLQLVALWIFLNTISLLILSFFRAREEATAYTVLSLGQFVLLLCLNIYFVYFLRLNVTGIVLGNVLSHAAIVLFSIPLLVKRVRFRFHSAQVSPLMRFGLLMIPTAAAGWVLGMSDRYLLRFFGELSEVGVYGLGYKFGNVMQILVVSPFQLAWPAFAFSISEDPGHRFVFARTLTYFTVVSVFIWLGLSLFTKPVLKLMANPSYFDAYKVVPLVAAAYLFNGIHFCVSPGIHIKEKSRYLPILVVGASIFNLGLNFLLIPSFGMMGAAWSTLFSFLALGLATLILAERIYPVSLEYQRIFKVGVLGIGLYGISFLLQPQTVLATCIWHGILAVTFLLVLTFSRFLEPDESRALIRMVRSWKLRFANLQI